MSIATRLCVLIAAACFFSLFVPDDAQAACGGDGEITCWNGCDSGHRSYLGICWDLEAQGFPSYCGGTNEPACGVGIRTAWGLPSDCKNGRRSYLGVCRAIDGSGYPTSCGGTNETSCSLAQVVAWGLPGVCKSGRRDYLGTCYALESEGFPDFCGGTNEPACSLPLQVAWGIDSCKSGRYEEVGVPLGTCRALDGDGYPTTCGDLNESPCTVDQIAAVTLITGDPILNCKPWLYRSGSILNGVCLARDADGFPQHCGGEGETPCWPWEHAHLCKQDLSIHGTPPDLECHTDIDYLAALDFWRPLPVDWNAYDPSHPAEEPAGPRTVFYVHGKGGSISDTNDMLDALADAGHDVYGVDYNADGSDGAANFTIHRLTWDDSDQVWGFEVHQTYGSAIFSGTGFTLQGVAQHLAMAIDDLAGTNVSVVAGSMGGLVARHLVYRHYDELRLAGHRIAEVVTLGSPHIGGGFGIPGATGAGGIDGAAIQEAYGCGGYRLVTGAQTLRDRWQICLLELWQRGRRLVGVPIDDSDYPQIHWVTLAGREQRLGTNGADDATPLDSDSVVAVESAFGIAMDACFPHTHLGSTHQVVSWQNSVDGEMLDSAECHHPEHLGIEAWGYDHEEKLEGIGHHFDQVDSMRYVLHEIGSDLDSDGDGLRDLFSRDFSQAGDNCTLAANADQTDTDGDGFGNACDADYDGDGGVGVPDLLQLRTRFGTNDSDPGWDDRFDANGDGAIGVAELLLVRRSFGAAPGPSAWASAD